jgi:hypothetical protein
MNGGVRVLFTADLLVVVYLIRGANAVCLQARNAFREPVLPSLSAYLQGAKDAA